MSVDIMKQICESYGLDKQLIKNIIDDNQISLVDFSLMNIQELSILCNLNDNEKEEIEKLQQLILQPIDQTSHVKRYFVFKHSLAALETISLVSGELQMFQWQEISQFLNIQQRDCYHKILKVIYQNNQIVSVSIDRQKNVINMQNILNILKIPQNQDYLVNKRPKFLGQDENANSFNVFSENIFAASINNEEDDDQLFNNIDDTFQQSQGQEQNDLKKFKFSDRPDTQFVPQKPQSYSNILNTFGRPRSSSGILSHQKQLISTQIICAGRVEIQLENTIFIIVPEEYYDIQDQQINQEDIDYLRDYQVKNGPYLTVAGISQNIQCGDIVKFELQPFSYEVNTFQSIKEQQGLFEIYSQNIEVIDTLTIKQQHQDYFIEGNTYQGIVYSYNEKDNFGFIKSVGEHKTANSLSQGLELYFKNSQAKPKNQIFQVGDLVTFKCHWMNERPQARDIVLMGSCIAQDIQAVIVCATQNYVISQIVQNQRLSLLNQNLIFLKRKCDNHKDNMSQCSAQTQARVLQIGQQILIDINVDISGYLKCTSFSKNEQNEKKDEIFKNYLKYYNNNQFSKNNPIILQNQCNGQLIQSTEQHNVQDQYICSYYGLIQDYVVWKCINQDILILTEKFKTEIQQCYKKQVTITIQDQDNVLFYQLNKYLGILVDLFRIN